MSNPLVAPKPIDSARVCIRPLSELDLPELLAINGDEEVTRFLGHAPWQAMADAEAWFKRVSALQVSGSALEFVIESKQSGKVIGRCALFDYDAANACIRVGYTLARAHWRQGYMREALAALIDCAFSDMNLRRLEAQVEANNTASTRLLERLGFTKEGVLRERWINFGNTTVNAEVFGLLRHEWQHVNRTRSAVC